MIDEIWKEIKGLEGLYEVSNRGQVRSMDFYIINSLGRVRFYKSKLRKLTIDKNGYLTIGLHTGLHKIKKVHRLVAQAFISNPENKPQVNHKDGNKSNNNDWNLEWCTNKENKQHAFSTGLTSMEKGEKSHNPKLTDKIVKDIRKRILNGYTLKEVGDLYNISISNVSMIKLNKTWNHIK